MPFSRLTVLIADDSALYRQMLQNVLQRIPNVDIVGTAVDGVDAVARALELRPDVITLDIQMPRLDGLGVLRELRARGSRTKAIMVSGLTLDGAPATVEALMEGAFDVIAKPVGVDPHIARASIHEALIEKLSAVVDGVPTLVEPYISVATTKGNARRVNPAWVSAPFEIAFLIGDNSFERLVPERFTGEGSFKFAPQLAMGELQWHYKEDNDCNLFGDFGFHKYEITRAYRPIRPANVIPILFRRCPYDTGIVSCPNSGSLL